MSPRNFLVRCLVGSCVFALPAADLSLPREYEGKPIERVRFEPSLQPVSRPDLERLVSFRPGSTFKLDDIREAIKRLYATGEYQDIEVSWEPSGNGVALVFHTAEQWFVGAVEGEKGEAPIIDESPLVVGIWDACAGWAILARRKSWTIDHYDPLVGVMIKRAEYSETR